MFFSAFGDGQSTQGDSSFSLQPANFGKAESAFYLVKAWQLYSRKYTLKL